MPGQRERPAKRPRANTNNAAAAAAAGADGTAYVFELLTGLPADDPAVNGVVRTFRSGADLTLQSEQAHELAAALDSLEDVSLDATSLDMLFESVKALDQAGMADLAAHPAAAHLCTFLYGLLEAAPRAVSLRAAKAYLSLLLVHGANASLVLNRYFVRRILLRVSQFLATASSASAVTVSAADPCSTQDSDLQLTPDLPASQHPHLSASQKPKRRRVDPAAAAGGGGGAGRRGTELPADWRDSYELVLHIVTLFQNSQLLACFDDELAAAVLEGLAALPAKEVAGPLRGKAAQPSPLLQASFDALKVAMLENREYEVYQGPAAAATAAATADDGEGAEVGEEDAAEAAAAAAAAATRVSAQGLVLPLLIPLLHLTPHYVHSCVKLSEAAALQRAALALVKEAGVSGGNLLLLFKIFVQAGERRPRSDPLLLASKAGVELLKMQGGDAERAEAARYIVSLAASDKVYHRVFAMEVSHGMLRDADVVGALDEDAQQAVVEALFKAVSDTAAVVRTKALTNLSRIMQAIGDAACPTRGPISTYLTRVRSAPLDPALAPAAAAGGGGGGGGGAMTPGSAAPSLPSNVSVSPGAATVACTEMTYLVAAVVARTREEKALVRKAAIDLLLQFFEHKVVEAGPVMSTVADLMDVKLEPSVLVRRQAVLCAWTMILHFPDVAVRGRMMAAILECSACETEEFVTKTMLQAVLMLVIKPLTGDERELKEEEVWQLTSSFKDSQLASLGKLCCKLLEEGEVSAGIVRSLLRRIADDPGCRDAWAMLPLFARRFRAEIDGAVIMRSLRTLRGGFDRATRGDSRGHSVLQSVLTLLPAVDLAPADAEEVVGTLEHLVLSLRCHANLVDAVVACFAALVPARRAERVATLFVGLCSAMLYNLLADSTAKPLPPDAVAAGLETVSLGDLPIAICTMGSLLLGAAQAAERSASGAAGGIKGQDKAAAAAAAAATATAVPAALGPVTELISAVCNTAATTGPADEAEGDGRGGGAMTVAGAANITGAVLLHSFVCQIRLCLLSKAMCKKGVPLLLKGLTARHAGVRTTCLNGLADVSLKYPGTVDKFLPNMASLLSDGEVRVRLTAATLLTQLLGESYLKMRPQLFFEMLAMVADPHASVAAFASYALLKVIGPKDPFVVTNNFKETLFVLNNYPFHPKFNKLVSAVTRLEGERHSRSRVQLMRFLAANVKGERDILKVHEQLHDILDMCTDDGAADGVTMDLSSPEGVAVFKDCLHVLMSPELTLAGRTLEAKEGGGGDPLEDDDSEMRMRRDLWAGAVKARCRDMVCPILASVSARLRRLRSPLQKELVHYAAYATQEYEKELGGFFTDEQLLKDVRATLEESRRGRGGARRVAGLQVAAAGVAAAPPSAPGTPCRTPGRESVGVPRTPTAAGTPMLKRRISMSR